MMKQFFVFCALANLAILAGCGGGSSSSPAIIATPTPTPAPTAPARLYASGVNVPSNAIAYFTAPLSAASTQTAAFATASGGEVIGLMVDGAGDVIASDQFLNTITQYARPTPTTSTQFTISPGFTPEGIAVDASGKVYVANYAGMIETASGPLSATSTFTPLITSNLSGPTGVCFDATGNLYVTNYGSGKINAYAPPYTGVPVIVSTAYSNAGSCSVDAATGQLIVSSLQGVFAGAVSIYTLPLTSASTPAAVIAYGSTAVTSIATDKAGLLYVAVGTPAIQVIAPPFSAASTPLYSIPLANTAEAMVFGS